MQVSPTEPEYKVSPFDGFPFVQDAQKAICFLEYDGDKFVNAKTKFLKSKGDVERAIRYGITQWLQGVNAKNRHHGWNASQHSGKYTECYVFKHVSKSIRFYGCLYHPSSNSRAIICCIIHFATKKEHEVDTNILDEINRLLAQREFKKALEDFWNGLQSQQGEKQ